MKVKILLLSKGYISNKIKLYLTNPNFEIVQISNDDLNYIDENMLTSYLFHNKFDFIINCFGFTGRPNVDGCEKQKKKCYDYNVNKSLMFNKFDIPVIHVSSGCLYNDEIGINSYTENDFHNFGWYNPTASHYSKCKSKFEIDWKEKKFKDSYILRIRMPYDPCLDDLKNYIGKVLTYDKLVNYKNSITDIRELAKVIEYIILNRIDSGVYNVVNPIPIDACGLISLLNTLGYDKKCDKFYNIDDLLSLGLAKCRRSNCVLSTDKIEKYVTLKNSIDSIVECVKIYKCKN